MNTLKLTLLCTLAATAAGCSSDGMHDKMGGMGMMSPGAMAVASLTPTQGNTVRGVVSFHEMAGHVMVHAKLSGLAPYSVHGFHLHDVGSCASADGTSAGGHFNPTRMAHGPQGAEHHAGDMPNLQANAQGMVDQEFMVNGITVQAGATSIDGRSVIVHAGPDDYATQPTGNSGARLACGVVAAH